MVIVADEKRRQEFQSKMSYATFERLQKEKRVAFLSYESLDKQSVQELQRQNLEFIV